MNQQNHLGKKDNTDLTSWKYDLQYISHLHPLKDSWTKLTYRTREKELEKKN